MDVLEVFGNISSLALIPIVIGLILQSKSAQIAYLKEQVKLLELFRPSEIEKDIEALKRLHEKRKKELESELDEITKEVENLKSLSHQDAKAIVELFKRAMRYMDLVPMSRATMGKGYISTFLYGMKGPIGDSWRKYLDEGKRQTKEEESGSPT